MMSRLDLLLVAGVALLALGCSGDDAGTTPQSGTSAAYSPPDSASAYPTPPPPPIPPSDQAIRDFIFGCTGAAGDANQAANELANCAPPDASKSRAEAAAGAMPIVLVDFLSAASGSECFFTKSYVTWKDSGGWQAQSVDQFLDEDAGTRLIRAIPPTAASEDGARSIVTPDGSLRLGIIHSGAECGSGAPEDGYLLLGFEDGRWTALWRSSDDPRAEFGHRRIVFAGEGIDSIRVTGDSWLRQDQQRPIFVEANARPHREFEQTWVRTGNSYELAEEQVRPTSYNTLVEFVYSVLIGDRAAAERHVVSPTLIDTAISLGLDRHPLTGGGWIAFCAEHDTDGSPCVIVINDVAAVRVSMSEATGGPLISGIEPCRYLNDSTGTHCD